MKLNEIIQNIEVWSNWVNSYKKYVPRFIEEAKTKVHWQDWDKDVFKEYFERSSDQCVSSLKQGYFTKIEKDIIKKNWSELAVLLKKIADQQDYMDLVTYDEVKKWFGKHTSQNRKAAANRLIASLQPNLLCTIVNEGALRTLMQRINALDSDAKLKISWNWFENSNKVLNYFKEKVSHENVYDIMTYPWQTYEILTQKQTTINSNEMSEEINNTKKSNGLNQILFGPPGTGKTYHTINKAIEICNPSFNLKQDRKVVKAEFDRLVKAEQIVFTTFHQSMSYEDFIEGIKPKTVNNRVHYEIEGGIFKQICHKARIKNGNFDTVIETFKKDISEIDGKPALTINAPSSSFDVIYRGTNVFYVQPHNSSKNNPWYPVNISNMQIAFDTNNYDKLYNPTYIRGILHYLSSNYNLVKGESENNKNYVLIIDEINRGNVSQIFGELITLIEESKRLGNDEALEVTLPYSKETFGVPPNLYIIGTMNTADRSVEALDTALRRRFSFEEMMPQKELLSPSALYCKLLWEYKDVPWENKEFMEKEKTFFEVFGYPDDFNIKKNDTWETMKESDDKTKLDYFKDFTFSLDLSQVLEIINKRIEILLDRDHTIGHSYFINVISLEDLENTFKNNIIPLLQEYFYNDYEKIALVLGEGFVEIKKPQGIQVKFAKLSVAVEQPEIKTVFSIKEEFNIQEAIRSLLKVNE